MDSFEVVMHEAMDRLKSLEGDERLASISRELEDAITSCQNALDLHRERRAREGR